MKKTITKYYRIKSDKINPSEFPIRIVFISDLHNGSNGKQNDKLISKIDSLAPDLVLLGGDTIIGKPGVSMTAGLDFIRELGKRHQIYAANGNHEYRLKIYPNTYGDMYKRYQKALDEVGAILLENKSVEVGIKGTSVVLHGLELDRAYYKRLKKKNLTVVDMVNYLEGIADDRYHVLLAHNPRYGQTYIDWGADLTLCGHYHGGIIKLPNEKGLIGNDFQLFPQYAYGHYRKEKNHVITSAGLGEHTIPLRINNPRELVVVDLH